MKLNPELLMVVIPALCWLLYALGGTTIGYRSDGSKMKGIKSFRRYGVALVLAGFCLFASWWQALLVGALTVGSFSLGYGVKHTWLKRILVGFAMGLISLPLGLSWWSLSPPLVFIGTYFLSNWKPMSDTFTWKLCEGLTGLSVGISVSYLLAGHGLLW